MNREGISKTGSQYLGKVSASISTTSRSFTVEGVGTGVPNRKDDLKSGRKKVAASKYL